MLPISEITQFPSVLVRLDGQNSAIIDDHFDSFVRPTLNPRLTPFSIGLTAITQAQVDAAPVLKDVLPLYVAWLQAHGLCDAHGNRTDVRWTMCTWSDGDIGAQLSKECRHKGLALPACLDAWVDLRREYERHFKMPPRGLQRSVEALGLEFTGRAHNGLVDSINTAKIAVRMAKGDQLRPAFVFKKHTRYLDRDGLMVGSKESKEAAQRRIAAEAADAGAGSSSSSAASRAHEGAAEVGNANKRARV